MMTSGCSFLILGVAVENSSFLLKRKTWFSVYTISTKHDFKVDTNYIISLVTRTVIASPDVKHLSYICFRIIKTY